VSNEWLPELTDLEDGHVAVAAVAVVQAITAEGFTTYYVKTTHGLDDMTCLGMLTAATDTQRSEVQRRWDTDD
jgi:hypothetical protein